MAIYVREDIPSLAKNDNFPWNVEAILVEINPRKAKLAMLDKYSSYDKFLIPGDLNMQEGHVIFDNFMEVHQAKNLVKEPTCYKNIENPSCVDQEIGSANFEYCLVKLLLFFGL